MACEQFIRIAAMNIHLVKGSKRSSFVQMKNWARVDLCAVVESWLKNNEDMIRDLRVGLELVRQR